MSAGVGKIAPLFVLALVAVGAYFAVNQTASQKFQQIQDSGALALAESKAANEKADAAAVEAKQKEIDAAVEVARQARQEGGSVAAPGEEVVDGWLVRLREGSKEIVTLVGRMADGGEAAGLLERLVQVEEAAREYRKKPFGWRHLRVCFQRREASRRRGIACIG